MYRTIRALSLAMPLVAISAPAVAQLTITNGNVTFQYSVNAPTYGFVPQSVASATTTVNFMPADAWVLTVWDKQNPGQISLPPSVCSLPTPTLQQTPSSFEATWSGITAPTRAPGLVFDLILRGDAPALSEEVEFDVEVVLGPDASPFYAIFALDYLRLEVLPTSSSNSDTLAWPYAGGWLIDNAATNPLVLPAPPPDAYDQSRFLEYPGPQSMQWCYLFDPAIDRGLYYCNEDPDGNHKGMQYARKAYSAPPTDVIVLSTRHYPADNRNVAGYRPGYKTVISATDGGWFAAAKQYRAWALTNLNTVARGPIETNPELSPMIRDTDFFAWWTPEACPDLSGGRLYSAFANLPGLMSEIQSALNLSVDPPSMCYEWDYNSFDIRYGEWLPEAPEFRAAALDTPQPVGAYFLLNSFETSLPAYAPFMSLAVTEDEFGAQRLRTRTPVNKQLRGCGTTPQTITVEEGDLNPRAAQTLTYAQGYADYLVGVADVDGLYLDAFSEQPSVLNYAAGQGHVEGGGTWWAQGMRDVIKGTRDYIKTKYNNRDFYLVSEGPQEACMDVLDGTIWWTVLLDVPAGGRRAAPLFRTVFHDYHRSIDFGTSIVPSRLPEVGNPFQWMLGRQRFGAALFMGAMPQTGGILPEDPSDTLASLRATITEFDRYFELMERTAEVITLPDVRKFIVFGERMRDFIDTGSGSWTGPNVSGHWPYGLTQPHVYGVSYRRVASNSAGILLVNWTDATDSVRGVAGGPQTVSLSLDAADLGIVPGATYTQYVYTSGSVPVVNPGVVWTNPMALNITVPERGAVFVSWE